MTLHVMRYVVAAIAMLACTWSIAQLYDTPETRRQTEEARRQMEAKEQEVADAKPKMRSIRDKEIEAKAYIGKTYWYMPNPNAKPRVFFFEEVPPSSFSQDPKIQFTPLTNNSFVVTDVVMPPPAVYALGEDEYLLKVQFPDGKVGYVNYLGPFGIEEHLFKGTRLPHNEYVAYEPPEGILAREKEDEARKQKVAEEELRSRRAHEERAAKTQKGKVAGVGSGSANSSSKASAQLKSAPQVAASGCDRAAAESVRKNFREFATWQEAKGAIEVKFGPVWDHASSREKRGLIEAFANADACLTGGARSIDFFRTGNRVGRASPSTGISVY